MISISVPVLVITIYNGHLGVVPRLKSRKSFIKCTEPINTTAKAARMELWRERLEPLDASFTLTSALTNSFQLAQRIPGQPGRHSTGCVHRLTGQEWIIMLKLGFSNEQETCDCCIRQTMQHLPQHWEGTIWRTYDSWWKDNKYVEEYIKTWAFLVPKILWPHLDKGQSESGYLFIAFITSNI